MIYCASRFKPKKKRKIKNEVARRINKSALMGTKMPTLTYTPRPAAEYARKWQSLNSNVGNTNLKESMVYSGDRKLLGIATMHKSCLQPVFSKQDAIDIARMRR